MKIIQKLKLTEKEKKAILNCVGEIDCDGIDCFDCPFSYNCGCMLETLRKIAEDS